MYAGIRDELCYNLVVTRCAKGGEREEAERLIGKMEEAGLLLHEVARQTTSFSH